MRRVSLEPLLQQLRIRRILPYIDVNGVLVDLGCGNPPVLLNLLAKRMIKCIGVDEDVPTGKHDNVEVFKASLDKKIKLNSNSADYITMLAVLEHLKHPEDIIAECFRVLKTGGKLLITVPSPSSKPVLEAFAKISLVRPEMIDQHEHYFTKQQLQMLTKNTGFRHVEIHYFECGFNTVMCAIK